MTNSSCVVAVLVVLGSAAPAFAQQYKFERSFDTGAAVTVDAETTRGKIAVTTAATNRVVVRGTVTVRPAFDAPSDAVARAQRLSANPPVQRDGDRVQLRPPSDASDRRAVTIAYDITVPPGASVIAISDSGALTIAGVGGHVTVRTQSGALALSSLGGPADIRTGSGAVDVDGAGGPLTVTTASSAIDLRGVRSDLHVTTGSGAVSAESRGPGDLEVTTSSSAVTLEGAAHGVRIRSGSGHIRVTGRPGAAWSLANSSGGVDVTLGSGAAATIDASTRSGSIHMNNLQVSGTQERQRVQGTIGAGGPTVEITNSSGTIDLRGR